MQIFECGNITDNKQKLENLKVKATRNEVKQVAVKEWNVKMNILNEGHFSFPSVHSEIQTESFCNTYRVIK